MPIIVVLSIIGAAVPMALFLVLVWWLDRYEREPVRMVGRCFLWGAVPAALGVLLLEMGAAALGRFFLPAATVAVISTALLSPIMEEAAKAWPLLWFRNHSDFNNGTDGIVYGTAIGFGFAVTENLCYHVDAFATGGLEKWLWSVVLRALYSGTFHALTTGLVGYFVGRGKFNRRQPAWVFPLGLSLAILAHIGWNTVLLSGEVLRSQHYFHLLAICYPLAFGALLALMQLSLAEESAVIRQELTEEMHLGVLLPDSVRILPYYWRRRKKGWISPKYKQEYLELSASLAFKKRELGFCSAQRRTSLLDEIESVRKRLRSMTEAELQS